MTSKTKGTIIRHLKGIVAALENVDKEETTKPEWLERVIYHVNETLDGRWNDGNRHIMTLGATFGKVGAINDETKDALKDIAKKRNIEIKINPAIRGVHKVIFINK